MQSNKQERGDDGNRAFELAEAAAEPVTPGLAYSDAERARRAEPVHDTGPERHQRLRPRELSDIPQESLAERIRRAAKGG